MESHAKKVYVNRFDKLNKNGVFTNKKVYLFGVSVQIRFFIEQLRKINIEPTFVLDNDINKHNSYCSRVKVVPVECILQETEDYVVIVCSKFNNETVAQLTLMGVEKKSIVDIDIRTVDETGLFIHGYKGYLLYKKIIKKYGETHIFLCPYTGTGDIYLIGMFWKEYIERNNIDNYVFVVINNVCRKVAELFDIKNIEVVKGVDQSEFLIRYYLFSGYKINLTILNDSWPTIHYNRTERFRGYKDLDFTKMFRKFVFDLPDDVMPQHPTFKNVDKEIDKFFVESNLEYGNTIILSPYSNTLADLPITLWELIAQRLLDRGFIVCTNSSGPKEPAIQGTIPIFFPISIAPQFIGKAGYFIGVRSGFCDIISGANAKKIVLYDKRDRFYNSSAFDYFSLKKMGLSDDVVELQYEEKDETLIEEILKNI